MREVPRITRGRRIAVGELRRVGLAEDDRARGPEPSDRGRVFAGPAVGEGPGAGGRRQSGDVKDILHGDRNTVHRPADGGALRLLGALARGGQGTLVIDVHPRLHAAVERANPLEARLDERHGAHGAASDLGRRLDHAERRELRRSHPAPLSGHPRCEPVSRSD